jgi:hypothetical protein
MHKSRYVCFAVRSLPIRTEALFDRAIWSSDREITIKDRIPVVKQWTADCMSSHQNCTISGSLEVRPAARLIEVVDTVQNLPVTRLVDTSEITGSPRYVTLSHCWGGIDIPNKTTLANIHEYKRAIPFDALPRTFQDAITVTRLLDVPYLWLDCLCIVQDDVSDWQQEAAKMASIFENAVCTITAASAENCHAGLGISAPLPPAAQFELPTAANPSTTTVSRFSSRRRGELPRPRDHYRQSLLHTRGWILQEMVLSRRIVHLLDGGLLWQCHTRMESEDGEAIAHYASPHMLSLHDGPLQSLLPANDADFSAMWWSTVADYTGRRLTYPADGMAAFSGITKFFAALSRGDEPVLGLWRANLPYHLAWQADSRRPAASCTTGMPSWSWFAIGHAEAAVSHPAHRHLGFAHAAAVRAVDIAWSGEPLTSTLLRWTVTLRTRLTSLTRIARGMMRDFTVPDWARAQASVALDPTVPGGGEAFAAGRVAPRSFEAALLYVQSGGREQGQWRIVYLVVEPAGGGRKGVYRRIGVASVLGFPAGGTDEAIVQRALQNMSKEVDITLV